MTATIDNGHAEPDLFGTDEGGTVMVLNPCQSLALRRLIEHLKQDDTRFTELPEHIRSAIADIYMPPYITAEAQIRALIEANEAGLVLLENFAARIKRLEASGKH